MVSSEVKIFFTHFLGGLRTRKLDILGGSLISRRTLPWWQNCQGNLISLALLNGGLALESPSRNIFLAVFIFT
jgi:hypothetical protein